MRYGRPAVFGEILVGLLLGPTAIAPLRLWPFASARDSPGNAVIAGVEEAKFGGETTAQGMQKESGTVSSPLRGRERRPGAIAKPLARPLGLVKKNAASLTTRRVKESIN